MGSTLSLDLMTTPSMCGTHFHMLPSHFLPQCILIFIAQPDPDGWVRDSEGGLLYWVPPDCRTGLHSPALLTIPLTSHIRSVSLDFEDFAFGTSWTHPISTYLGTSLYKVQCGYLPLWVGIRPVMPRSRVLENIYFGVYRTSTAFSQIAERLLSIPLGSLYSLRAIPMKTPVAQ
jgi:hypothetical protein